MDLAEPFKIDSADMDRDSLIKLFAYQPFMLPDGTVTGAGLSMREKSNVRALKESDNHASWTKFIRAVRGQAQMYEDMLGAASIALGSFDGLSYCEFACNAGYSVHRAHQMGAAEVTGYDYGDFGSAFELVNANTGANAEFIRGAYDMHAHEFGSIAPGRQFDIVSNIAFMCHCSDPTFLLEALAKRAKRALIIQTRVLPTQDYCVEFSKTTKRYFGLDFPLCFDGATAISEGLLRFGLKDLGFSKVTEIPRSEYWVPIGTAWRAFLAVR
tara:strand:- start:1807 stop:2616 length:810 start_codon:yes stop_codon:yes gene_type:complete